MHIAQSGMNNLKVMDDDQQIKYMRQRKHTLDAAPFPGLSIEGISSVSDQGISESSGDDEQARKRVHKGKEAEQEDVGPHSAYTRTRGHRLFHKRKARDDHKYN